MQWLRAKVPDNISKTTSDVFSEFYKSQGLNENNTPIIDEGLQNSIDASIKGEIPKIKIKRIKVKKSFFQKFVDDDFLKWNDDSMVVRDKYFLKNEIDSNTDVDCLLFEDFNTTGVKGNPSEYKTTTFDNLGKKIRNDYHIFIWYVGTPADAKDKSKGGSVGVGRLTFAFTSKINTFFMYTTQENDPDKSYFVGLTNFGKSKSDSDYDPIARYGVKAETPGGNESAEPVTGNDELKMIREGFELSRKPKEPGTSMIVPFPQDVITDETLIKNAIDRYRYGLFHGHFELEIGNTLINKDTILDVIKKFTPLQHEKYSEYFKFLSEAKEIEANNTLIQASYNKEVNPSNFKKDFLTSDDFEKICDDYKNERIIGIKLPIYLKKKIENDEKQEEEIEEVETSINIFLKKTSVKFGMDDVMRGPMSVSGERQLEELDIFGLTKINVENEDIHEFCRKLESPNHRYFDNANEEFHKKYQGYRHQKQLITLSLSKLKNLILEKDSEFSSEATKDFFSFGDPDKDLSKDKNGDPSNVKTKGETPFNLPFALFSNPKGYILTKNHSETLAGFSIKSSDLKKSSQEIINKINTFIEENKEKKEFTKKVSSRLENQKIKLSNWLDNKNLDELFPANIYITCGEDVEGLGDTSLNLHDNDHDFDLSNNLKHTIQIKKDGNIKSVQTLGNKITITVDGPDFYYQLKTDAFYNSFAKEHSDLRLSVYMRAINEEKNI